MKHGISIDLDQVSFLYFESYFVAERKAHILNACHPHTLASTMAGPGQFAALGKTFTWCPLPHISEYKLTWTNNAFVTVFIIFVSVSHWQLTLF